MVDEPGAISIPSPNYFADRNGYSPKWIICHGTAGFSSAQDVGVYFQTADVSANYVVGQDGTKVQCVAEKDGAWGNGVISAGHDSWWTSDINPNWVTISIEHVKPHTDNSDILTDAQKAASFELIDHICQRHGIPRRMADANGGITGHFSIDPVNRSQCPGPYPWDELIAYLNNGGEHVGIPNNWKDDGTTLVAPNNIPVVRGFRDYILSHPWSEDNIPLEAEHGANPLEVSNPGLGGGTQQRFRTKTLEWTSSMGVFEAWTGQELIALDQKVQWLEQQLASTQNANVQQLQAQLDAANKQLSAKNTALAQIATEATNASK